MSREPSLATAFQMPRRTGTPYIQRIHRRSHRLIETQIWSGLSRVQFDAWWKNFRSDEELYFAACVLDALIYRSNAQTISLMQQLFQRVLPDAFRGRSLGEGMVGDILSALRGHGNNDPATRLVVVVRRNDPPTKSANLIARMYRRKLDINDDWIISPDKIAEARSDGAKVFIFIDDFLGTGKQFRRFAQQYSLVHALGDAKGIYAPLVAHARGVSHLQHHLPEVPVVCAELLDDSYRLFHQRAPWFNDGVNTSDSARAFYFGLLRDRGINASADFREGFGRLSLSYCFEHGVPNNCLPILWHATPAWQPFLER